MAAAKPERAQPLPCLTRGETQVPITRASGHSLSPALRHCGKPEKGKKEAFPNGELYLNSSVLGSRPHSVKQESVYLKPAGLF